MSREIHHGAEKRSGQKNDEVTYGKGNAPQEVAQTVFGAITDNDPGKDNAKYNCNDDSCVGRVGKVKHRPAEKFFTGCSIYLRHRILISFRNAGSRSK